MAGVHPMATPMDGAGGWPRSASSSLGGRARPAGRRCRCVGKRVALPESRLSFNAVLPAGSPTIAGRIDSLSMKGRLGVRDGPSTEAKCDGNAGGLVKLK